MGSFMTAATMACPAGQFTEIGRYKLSAGMGLALGYDNMAGQDSAAGRFYMDLKNSAASPGAAIDGEIRIELINPQDRVQAVVWEGTTRQLRSSATDRRQQLPFPWINAIATEHRAFRILFKPEGAATLTVGKDNSVLAMDVTNYEAD
jgi:hypothetical protein